MLVVIGPKWLASLNNRIARGEPDIVRRKIAACLDRSDVRVIPVLVKGAAMPAAGALPDDVRRLADRNAIDVRSSAWKYAARLVKVLRKAGALPASSRQWMLRSAAALGLVALGGGAYFARTEVPAVPISMTRPNTQALIERAGLRVKANEVKTARFQGYVVETSPRGIQVAAEQRPAPGTRLFRWQTVEVDFIVREPYRLICKGGGVLSMPAKGDVLAFEKHQDTWSVSMPRARG